MLLLLQYGTQDVQLSAAEQLVDRSQTRAVAEALKWLQARLKQQQQQGLTLRQWLDQLEAAFDQQVGPGLKCSYENIVNVNLLPASVAKRDHSCCKPVYC